jgi:heme oxygenase
VVAIAGRPTSGISPGRHDPTEADGSPQDRSPQDRSPQDRSPQDGSRQDRAGLSVELRRLTRADHERVELLVDLPDRLTRRGDLAVLLHGWQQIWREIKHGCAGAGPGVGAKGWPGETAALGRLAEESLARIAVDLVDLAELDHMSDPSGPAGLAGPAGPAEGKPDSPFSPLLADEPGVWAVAYVLRGSGIGGQVLAPLITARLDLPPGAAMSYHAGAEDVGRSWVAFRRRLDGWGVAAGPEQRQVVVRRTRVAFALIGRQMAHSQPAGGTR